MAVMKKSVRKKLSKYLERLIKKHGAEMTLALVTGIVSSIAADGKAKEDRDEARKAAKELKRAKAGKVVKVIKVERVDKLRPEKVVRPEKAARLEKAARVERAVRTDLDAADPEYRESSRKARGRR